MNFKIRTDFPATNRKVICNWVLNDLEIGIIGIDLRINITIISYTYSHDYQGNKSIFGINENNCKKSNNLKSLKSSKIIKASL